MIMTRLKMMTTDHTRCAFLFLLILLISTASRLSNAQETTTAAEETTTAAGDTTTAAGDTTTAGEGDESTTSGGEEEAGAGDMMDMGEQTHECPEHETMSGVETDDGGMMKIECEVGLLICGFVR